MDAAKDTGRKWNKYDPPRDLKDWRLCSQQGLVDDGLRAFGLGDVVEAKKVVEEARQNAALNFYRPKTLADKSEPNKE